MTTVTVSPKFQVVIPLAIRQALGLAPGQQVQVIQYDNRVEFIPLKKARTMRGFLKGLDTAAIEIIAEHFANAPSPFSAVAIELFGGAVNRVGIDDTAFHHRDARYNLLIVGAWTDEAAKAENVAWVRDLWDAMEPYSSGAVYVNYLGEEADEGAERIKSAYGPEKYDRLVALKDKYDPTNLFRLNQNIKPSAG